MNRCRRRLARRRRAERDARVEIRGRAATGLDASGAIVWRLPSSGRFVTAGGKRARGYVFAWMRNDHGTRTLRVPLAY
jgi:hypothetical protein